MGYSFKAKDVPLIFVPEMFGSIGDNIVYGARDWEFGQFNFLYRTYLRILEKMGYILNENLFIAHYDWRKECFLTSFKYLKPIIDRAKRERNCEKVNLICHGFGGIIARTYIQSNYYYEDISKLILVGTPNTGIAESYSFWKNGEFPTGERDLLNSRRMFMNSYVMSLKKSKDHIDVIQKEFLALRNILPSKEYGDYIYYDEKNGTVNFKSQEHMSIQNNFLNNLNKNKNIIYKRGINIISIAGTGKRTVQYLCEDKEGEKVLDYLETKDGDGVVTVKSALFLDGEKYLVYVGEEELLEESAEIVKEKL